MCVWVDETMQSLQISRECKCYYRKYFAKSSVAKNILPETVWRGSQSFYHDSSHASSQQQLLVNNILHLHSFSASDCLYCIQLLSQLQRHMSGSCVSGFWRHWRWKILQAHSGEDRYLYVRQWNHHGRNVDQTWFMKQGIIKSKDENVRYVIEKLL